MSRLTLQFKKSPFIKSKIWFWGSCLLACQFSMQDIPQPSHSLVGEATDSGVRLSSEASFPTPVLSGDGEVRVLPDLSHEKDELTWSPPANAFCKGQPRSDFPAVVLPVKNLYGESWEFLKLKLISMSMDGSGVLELVSDDQRVERVIPLEDAQQMQNLICSVSEDPELIKSQKSQLMSLITGWLGELVPDCQFRTLSGEGWECRLNETGPALAGEQLRVMSRNILRQWKRQPYIFSRRIALSQQLVMLLNQGYQEEEIARFCSLLSWSIPKEIPLVMRLESWQNSFCHGSASEVQYWGQVALELSLKELTFLKDLADRSNHTRSLLVRVPRSDIQSRELKVHLEPGEDVADLLMEKALEMIEVQAADTATQSSFWHPMLRNKDNKFKMVASVMGLSRFPANLVLSGKQGSENPLASKYFFESLMGEADFVVGNGRYKVLHLPEGSYRYKLYDLEQSTQPWEEESKSLRMSQGSLSWQKSGSNPSIKKW